MRLRLVLEQATHRIVVRRRLPPPFEGARIYTTTEGGLRYLARRMTQVDPVLLRLAAEVVEPGATVWDIGANIGLFSFAAAVAAGPEGHVLAVEPDTDLTRMLRRSAAVNRDHASVKVLAAAVCDELSVARFHIAKRNRATSHLDGFGTAMAGGVRATELVPTVTLDWLADRFPAPDVIKIDVEEAEMTVLTGGSRVLDRSPTIICEVAESNATPVWELLNARGYAVYDGDRPRRERVPAAAAPPNTLAIITNPLSGKLGADQSATGSRPRPAGTSRKLVRTARRTAPSPSRPTPTPSPPPTPSPTTSAQPWPRSTAPARVHTCLINVGFNYGPYLALSVYLMQERPLL